MTWYRRSPFGNNTVSQMDEMSPGKLVHLRKPDPRAHIKFSALLTLPKLPSALWPEVMASSFQLVVFPLVDRHRRQEQAHHTCTSVSPSSTPLANSLVMLVAHLDSVQTGPVSMTTRSFFVVWTSTLINDGEEAWEPVNNPRLKSALALTS